MDNPRLHEDLRAIHNSLEKITRELRKLNTPISIDRTNLEKLNEDAKVMTNGEKFQEVFGFEPDKDACIFPDNVCRKIQQDEIVVHADCEDCPLYHFFDKEYMDCFKMIEV